MKKSQEVIIKEALDPDGMIVGFRCGIEPPKERLLRLIEALESLAVDLKESKLIDRKLSGALHLLSFHAVGLIESKESYWSDTVEDLMPLIYEHIDEIFGVYE